MTDKRIPKPGEVWTLKSTGITSEVLNVYPDCLTYRYNHHDERATTIDDFLNRYSPPEPTVVSQRHVMWEAVGENLFTATHPDVFQAESLGTIAVMSDGTARFEAAS